MKAFDAMSGEEVLKYVRDVVLAAAANKRSFAEQSAAVGNTPLSKDELAELAAFGAAADIIQFAVSAGQDAKASNEHTPEWVLKIAVQARRALVAEKEPEAEA